MFKNIKIRHFEKVNLIHNPSRSISTTDTIQKYAQREGKFMNKILRGEQVKRKWYLNKMPTQSHGDSTKKSAPPPNLRRNTVLNKLFMKYITDLMATGEVAPDLLGRGIEITRVSVTPDFQFVNVFWLVRCSVENDDLIKEILNRAAGPLRHELSQLRVMGVVPLIKFVKDKQYSKFVEIDQRLAIADFGEDFVPTDPTLRLRTTPVLNLKLPPSVWSDIEELEKDLDDEMEISDEPLPEMRNDVLGLDHHRIMTRIKNSMDKSKAGVQRRILNIVSPLPQGEGQSSQVTEYLTAKQRQSAFTAFLVKRQVDEQKRKKYAMNQDCEEELDFHDDVEFEPDYMAFDLDDEISDEDIGSVEVEDGKIYSK